MIRRPPRSTLDRSSAASDVYKRQELLRTIVGLNELTSDDVVSIIFTTTADLNATFPAVAARAMGLDLVPLMCSHEMAVPGALDMVVRVMMHINTCLLYTSPSPRDRTRSRMPSSA